jgi:hypothetical protein
MTLGLILYVAAVLCACGVLICRAGAMTPDTLPPVRWQHLVQLAGLVFGLALSLVAGPGYGGAAHAAGVLGALLLSAPRWRHGPPAGTLRRNAR